LEKSEHQRNIVVRSRDRIRILQALTMIATPSALMRLPYTLRFEPSGEETLTHRVWYRSSISISGA